MTQPARPTIAVVSVSYGSEAELEAMLGSLPAAASAPLLVVVADNLPGVGSTREVVTAASASYAADALEPRLRRCDQRGRSRAAPRRSSG